MLGCTTGSSTGRAARRGARRMIVASLLAAFALAAAAPSAGAVLPPQGVYEQCAPGRDACLDRLAEIRSAGFTVVLNYMQWYGTSAEIRRYAEHAGELGLELIYPLNAPQWRGEGELIATYPDLGRDCACSGGEAFVAWAVDLVRRHPSTWGWYIGDEVDPARLPAVQALGARLRELDPGHPQLYVSYENPWTNGDNLRPFGAVADVVGSDYYPIGTPFELDATGDIASQIQRIADAGGRRSAAVLQAFSWDQYTHSAQIAPRWPTRAEMARQRDLVLARAEPALILWYSFFDVARSDDPARRLEDLSEAAFSPEPEIEPVVAPEAPPPAPDGPPPADLSADVLAPQPAAAAVPRPAAGRGAGRRGSRTAIPERCRRPKRGRPARSRHGRRHARASQRPRAPRRARPPRRARRRRSPCPAPRSASAAREPGARTPGSPEQKSSKIAASTQCATGGACFSAGRAATLTGAW
jgi:hypothetical protein